MIIWLLVTMMVVSIALSLFVVAIFNEPIKSILNRVVPEELCFAWLRYLRYAILVVGIGGGAQIWNIEKYLSAQEPQKEIVQLTPERWILEIYNTAIGTLQSTAILLMVFFIFALIAVVVVRLSENRQQKPPKGNI